MTCARDGGSEAAERYAAGTMAPAERTAFERHCGTCAACRAAVDRLAGRAAPPRPVAAAAPALLALAAIPVLAALVWLASRPAAPAGPAAPVVARRATLPAAAPAPLAAQPVAATWPGDQPDEDAVLDRLAEVVPPRYPSLPSGGETGRNRQDFVAAMAHYAAGRYAEAARALGPLVERAPELVHAQFFLGVSELAVGDTAKGRPTLQRVVQSGIPPFADEAHFYLAKAALADRRLDVAVDELNRAIAAHAGPAGEAERLLARVQALRQ